MLLNCPNVCNFRELLIYDVDVTINIYNALPIQEPLDDMARVSSNLISRL